MSNGDSKLGGFAVTSEEFEQFCIELSETLTEMKTVINTHAEALALHRAIFEDFFPKQRLEDVAAWYYKRRMAEIQGDEEPLTDASKVN